MPALYIPPAVNMLIPRGTIGGAGQQPTITPWMVILHTNAGNTSLAGAASLMANTTKGQEFHVQQEASGTGRIAGRLGQYVDFTIRADNNYKANSFNVGGRLCGAISIETADHGHPYEKSWTDLGQRPALEDLLVWLCQRLGIPAVKCPDPFGRGLGYHSMWGYNTPDNMDVNPWTNTVGKICPGPGKIREFPDLLAAVARRVAGGPPPSTPGDDDVAWLLRCTNGTPTQNAQIFGWNGVSLTWLGSNQAEVLAVGKITKVYANDGQILTNFDFAQLQAMVNSSYSGPPGVTIPGFTTPPIPAALLTAALAGVAKEATTAKQSTLIAVQEQVGKIPTTPGEGGGSGEELPTEYEITLTGKATRPGAADTSEQ